jgi:hypothetical protein
MLTVAQDTLHDGLEAWLVQVAAQQPVAGRRVSGDRRRQDPARAQHSPRFGQCRDPVAPVGQVVQGTGQQDGVDTGVRAVQLPGAPTAAPARGSA